METCKIKGAGNSQGKSGDPFQITADEIEEVF